MNINNISGQNFHGCFAQAYKGKYLFKAIETKFQPQIIEAQVEKPIMLQLSALPNIPEKTTHIKNNSVFSPFFEFFAHLF